jgi:hypothetical protein
MLLLESATYNSMLLSIEIPLGEFSNAFVPRPFANPDVVEPPPPAKVFTTPGLDNNLYYC